MTARPPAWLVRAAERAGVPAREARALICRELSLRLAAQPRAAAEDRPMGLEEIAAEMQRRSTQTLGTGQ